jgi:hypothetical protein
MRSGIGTRNTQLIDKVLAVRDKVLAVRDASRGAGRRMLVC